MRTTISQRLALSSEGRARYAAPPAAPMTTVPCLENPFPIWYMVTPDGVAAVPSPGGVVDTLPKGVHRSLAVTGRIDSILPQRSQSPVGGAGACASANDAARASAGATTIRRVEIIRAVCSGRTSRSTTERAG